MSTDQLFHVGIGLGVLGFSLAGWMLLGPGCVRRIQAGRRRKADRGWVRVG